MRTAPSRRNNGKFGVEEATTSTSTFDGKFKKGQAKLASSGRRAGTPNKATHDLDELRAKSGLQDELAFLEWVWRNDEVRMDLRLKAAGERAQYFHAKSATLRITTTRTRRKWCGFSLRAVREWQRWEDRRRLHSRCRL